MAPRWPENVALLSNIFWPVVAPFCGASVRPNMLNVPKSASVVQGMLPGGQIDVGTTPDCYDCCCVTLWLHSNECLIIFRLILCRQRREVRSVMKTTGIWWSEPEGLVQNRTARFSTDRRRHLMSLITMLGPSPDWCAGACQAHVNCFFICLTICHLFCARPNQ